MQEHTSPPAPSTTRRRGLALLRRRWPVLLPAAVAAAAVLAACADPAGGAASKDSHGRTQVTVGKAVDTIGFTTVDVAQAKGYFAKEGVTAKQELLGGSSTAFAALQSGSVHFVTASSTALLNARTKNVPIEAVASLDYGVSLQLVASKDWARKHHLSPKQPLTTVMRGLQGSTLGVISTTDLTYEHYLMKQAGVSQDKFKTITIKTQAAALAALQHGQIDAFLLSPPNSYFAQAQGSGEIVASLHSVPLLKKMSYDVLVTSTSYAKAHPDVVRAVATGMARADNVMAKDPRSVLDVEKKHYPKMSSDVLLQSLRYVTFAPDGKFTAEGWKDARTEARQSDVPHVESVDVTEDNGTWTDKYIRTSTLSSGAGAG